MRDDGLERAIIAFRFASSPLCLHRSIYYSPTSRKSIEVVLLLLLISS